VAPRYHVRYGVQQPYQCRVDTGAPTKLHPFDRLSLLREQTVVRVLEEWPDLVPTVLDLLEMLLDDGQGNQ
jgi:hypothetical protein